MYLNIPAADRMPTPTTNSHSPLPLSAVTSKSPKTREVISENAIPMRIAIEALRINEAVELPALKRMDLPKVFLRIGIEHLQINLARLGVALALRLKDAFVKSCSAYRRYCHNLPQVLCFPMCLSLPCHANRSCTVTTNTRRSTVVTISPRRNCISFGMRYSLGSKPLPSTASLACGKLGITKHLSKLRLLTSTMLTPKLITFN